jgi:hypothetical protein
LWKLACVVYVAPYVIVQAYYTCNLNPVEIKLLASNVSNGEISGLSSKYHRRTSINKKLSSANHSISLRSRMGKTTYSTI